jgi:hypothetical protein
VCHSISTKLKNMDKKKTKSQAFSLLNGNYKVTGNWYRSIVVNGSKGLIMGRSNSKLEVGINLGDFEEADPEIYKIIGQNSYNIEFIYTF